MTSRPDGPAKYDPNTFGTNEFMRFCRLAGGTPYLAANLRSLPARDFYQWGEYCNSPAASPTAAHLRYYGGHRQPVGVSVMGGRNQSWGRGGNYTTQTYARESP